LYQEVKFLDWKIKFLDQTVNLDIKIVKFFTKYTNIKAIGSYQIFTALF